MPNKECDHIIAFASEQHEGGWLIFSHSEHKERELLEREAIDNYMYFKYCPLCGEQIGDE